MVFNFEHPMCRCFNTAIWVKRLIYRASSTNSELLPPFCEEFTLHFGHLLQAQNKKTDPFLSFVTAILFKKINAHVRGMIYVLIAIMTKRDALFEGPVPPSNTWMKYLFGVKILLFGSLSMSGLGDIALSKGFSRRKGTANDMETLQRFS